MFAARQKSPKGAPRGGSEAVRKDKLMSKLLLRVVDILKSRGEEPASDILDAARKELDARWQEHHGTGMPEKELRAIVANLRRAKSSLAGPAPAAPDIQRPTSTVLPDAAPPQKPDKESKEAPEDASTSQAPSRMKELLMSTTHRQRQMMADAEWIRAAEEDRVGGMVRKKEERQNRSNAMNKQKDLLDQQRAEHDRQKEEDRQHRLRMQREMDEHIEEHRRLTFQERQEAFDKSTKEKRFREDQQKQLDQQREKQRQDEHEQQVREYMMAKQELQRQRDLEMERKREEKSEWRRMLQDNQERLREKAAQKEREREIDRNFQKQAADSMDRQERERAEAKARKQARAEHFKKLADGVATMFERKQQDLGSKIEAEYQEQLRREQQDERDRRQRNKQRTQETQEMLRQQCAEKKRQEEKERDEARAFAQYIRDQQKEAQHQEECRRQAARAEAQRMKEFLNTQLQLNHFKETKPLETSITRPESRARTMFSPSRYTPSPTL